MIIVESKIINRLTINRLTILHWEIQDLAQLVTPLKLSLSDNYCHNLIFDP